MTIEEGLTIMHLQKLLGPAHRFAAKGAEIWGKQTRKLKPLKYWRILPVKIKEL